ncbi:ABC1 kinase family protein [Microbacterium telephonicum]|uniref:Putative unusual protein kinase regulating ubiquinone biosynthesis (AarF/ABC1/UbiB family) n=1 Tax=Microbacterium telephonicum TaxID=1714841 RepID=A0A498C904_9MICO|nr:AarF/UbiB family protein [Microbacterium telephonicum]RLK49390.1 putative unusual protein kinase regulating ubiquinone biosynthesis (AarF/ABC1/UbiB family) [Microbacterium telephonicum]
MTDAAGTSARYRRILRFAARYLVQTWWFEFLLPRIGLGRIAERSRADRTRRIAERFRALAIDLGGLMIKVGQFMSSRLDVLPPEITKELEGLQDEVPPVPFAQMRVLAEAEFGAPLERVFASFDPVPVAAASLGQAHRARLAPHDAADTGLGAVVVKIQRPGIEQIVDVDLAALNRVADWVSRMRAVRDRVDLHALLAEFAATSREEIDYLHEAQSAERFAADFAGDPRVAAPEIVWERTTRRVLTLQDVTAIKINDHAALAAAGIDPAEVAQGFAGVMFDQLFEHGFFHGDPHPGNVFVTPLTGGHWRLTFIDFGMMGEVSDTLRQGLRHVLLAVASRDGQGLVKAMRDVGVLLPSADTVELERALSALFSRFGGMGFAQLRDVDPREFRDFAHEFGDVVRTMPFQLPESFLLIVRAMSLTSGVCSALDPDFNVWDAVEPYAGKVLREEGRGLVADLAQQALGVVTTTARLPQRIDRLVTRFEEGRVAVDLTRLERRIDHLERLAFRVLGGVLFAGTLIGGVLLQLTQPTFGGVLMGLSIVPLLYAVIGGRRRHGG